MRHPGADARADRGIRSALLPSLALLAALATGLWTPARASAAEQTVAIVNSHYKPSSLMVSLGDTVTWINEGFLLHNVTSTDGEFVSGTLHGGQRFSVKFTKAGTFDYVCTIHPGMSGKVIVMGQSSSQGGEKEGEAPAPSTHPTAPAGTARVSLKLIRAAGAGRRMTRVAVTTSRPHAEVLLQVYSREHFAWIQVAHARLGANGGASFRLRAGLHREVRAIVPGGPGEGPSISSAVRS
jgi:plastocyanin